MLFLGGHFSFPLLPIFTHFIYKEKNSKNLRLPLIPSPLEKSLRRQRISNTPPLRSISLTKPTHNLFQYGFSGDVKVWIYFAVEDGFCIDEDLLLLLLGMISGVNRLVPKVFGTKSRTENGTVCIGLGPFLERGDRY